MYRKIKIYNHVILVFANIVDSHIYAISSTFNIIFLKLCLGFYYVFILLSS